MKSDQNTQDRTNQSSNEIQIPDKNELVCENWAIASNEKSYSIPQENRSEKRFSKTMSE